MARITALAVLIPAIVAIVGDLAQPATATVLPVKIATVAYPLTAVFTPDGRFFVTADVRGVVIRDAPTFRMVRALASTTGAGPLAALSRDGRLMATGSPRGKIVVFEVPSGRPIASLGPISKTHVDKELDEQTSAISEVDALAISPDGTLVAAAENIGEVFGSKYYTWSSTAVHVWDTRTGRKLAVLRGHEAPRGSPAKVVSVAFAPHGDVLATGGEDGTARLWHARTGQLIGTLNHMGRAPFGLIFTSDGRRLITATKTHVRVWDLRSGRPAVRASARDHLEEFESLALDPSETFVAVGQADYLIRFWSLEDGRVIRTLGWKQQWHFVVAVAFSPDGKLLAAAPWETGPVAIIELWKLSP